MTGFAVIDLETTGFAYNHTDRVCEIGVVLVDPDGRREDAWTTLINPQRDLGAQHIHGIDASEARVAPTFDQVAGDQGPMSPLALSHSEGVAHEPVHGDA